MPVKDRVEVEVLAQTRKGISDLGKFAVATAGAAAAVAGLVKVGKDLLDAYLVQEKAEARLAAAVRITGRESEINVDRLKSYASQLQKVTTFGDEATISAMAMVQQLGNLSEEGLMVVTPLIQDFAAAMELDLNTAASLVGKTLGSTTNALTRYTIDVDMAGSESEKLADIVDGLTEKFGGFAEEMAKTTAGELLQLQGALSDLKEPLGEVVALLINPFMGALQGMAENAGKIINFLVNGVDWMDKTGEASLDAAHGLDMFAESEERVRSVIAAAAAQEALNARQLDELSEEFAIAAAILRDTFIPEQEEATLTLEQAVAQLREMRDGIRALGHEFSETDPEIQTLIGLIEILAEKERELQAVQDAAAAARDAAWAHGAVQRKLAADGVRTEAEEVIALAGAYGLFLEIQTEAAEETEEAVEAMKNNWQGLADIMVGTVFETFDAYGEILKNTGASEASLFFYQKGVAIGKALINTAVAITKALAELGPIAGPIAAGFLAITGGAQVAAIASQQPPAEPTIALAGGGIVTGPTIAMIGEAGREAVIPLDRGGFGNTVVVNVHGNLLTEDRLKGVVISTVREMNRGY